MEKLMKIFISLTFGTLAAIVGVAAVAVIKAVVPIFRLTAGTAFETYVQDPVMYAFGPLIFACVVFRRFMRKEVSRVLLRSRALGVLAGIAAWIGATLAIPFRDFEGTRRWILILAQFPGIPLLVGYLVHRIAYERYKRAVDVKSEGDENSMYSSMGERAERTNHNSKNRSFHWLIATPLSIWCLYWLTMNGYNYVYLTWRLFSRLKWLSLMLLINPCFLIWVGFFSASVWAPLCLLLMPWGNLIGDLSRRKVALLVLLVPMLLALLLQFIGPYFYPITWGGEDGKDYFIRFIPILGGRGYG